MPNLEQLEKEKQLIAFREEIQKLIDEAQESKKRGEKYQYPHFQLMDRADSLTIEDMEWWELMQKTINKDYSAMLQDFNNDSEAFKNWHNDTTDKLNVYKLPPKEEDLNRFYFIQEIKNKIGGKLLEFELDLQ